MGICIVLFFNVIMVIKHKSLLAVLQSNTYLYPLSHYTQITGDYL